jgi:hypothetical protein
MTMLTPVAAIERTRGASKPSGPRPSQRELVAMSLLLCPDGPRAADRP